MNDNMLWEMREELSALIRQVRGLVKDLDIMSCRIQALELEANHRSSHQSSGAAGKPSDSGGST